MKYFHNKLFLFYLLSCLCCQFSWSQTAISKSKIDSLNNLSFDFKIANSSHSIKIYNKNLSDSKKIKYQKGVADSYSNLGLVYYYQGKYDLNTSSTLNAIKIYQKIGLKSKLAHVYGDYGFQLKRRDLKQAVYYMIKGIKIAESIDDEYELRGIYDNYGVLKELSGDLDSALIYYNKSLNLKEIAKDNFGIPYSVNKIAMVKLSQNKHQEAKKLFDYSYQIRLAIKDKIGIAENLNLYGYYYKKTRNNSLAIAYFNKAIAWSKKYNYSMLTQENYKVVSELYENNEDYKNALSNYKNHTIYKDSIDNINIRSKQAELDTEYETEQKEKEILIQRAKLAEKNLWILGGFSLACIAVLTGYLFFNQQRQKTIQLQKENELKEALLKIEIQNKLQEQRLRISRDLHDNIGAQLTFIISSIDNLKYGFKIEDQNLQSKLNGISGFTKETIYELRDTIWAMNKEEITFEDLRTRISNFIDNAKLATYGTDFQFICHGEYKKFTFSSLEGMTIYRIIQEAINNAIKHANATKILVNVIKEKNTFQIEIKDNGDGFDIENTMLGNGMNNIKKRAKEINAEIIVTSLKNEGTIVKFNFYKSKNN